MVFDLVVFGANSKTNSIRVFENHILSRKVRKRTGFHLKPGSFYGCGGRTRTYDLRVMRGFWASLSILNTLKCVELVQVFGSFTGKSEQFSYSPTIVDTHICAFFDGVLGQYRINATIRIIQQVPSKNCG